MPRPGRTAPGCARRSRPGSGPAPRRRWPRRGPRRWRTRAAPRRPCPRRSAAPRGRRRRSCSRALVGQPGAAFEVITEPQLGLVREDRGRAAHRGTRPPPGNAPCWSPRPGHQVAYIDATGPERTVSTAHLGGRSMTNTTGTNPRPNGTARPGPHRDWPQACPRVPGRSSWSRTPGTPVLVWEWPYFPVYYFPAADVRAELVPAGETEHSPSRGDAEIYDVSVAGATAERRRPALPGLAAGGRCATWSGWTGTRWTEWFEEDEPVYTHPRDPYTPGGHPGQLPARPGRGGRR